MASENTLHPNAIYGMHDHGKEYTTIFVDKKAISELPVNGINQVFFTAPELGLRKDSFASNEVVSPAACVENNARILKLPMSDSKISSIYTHEMIDTLAGKKGAFMNIFTNRAASLPASAEQLGSIDYSETWNKYKMVLGTSTKDSKISGNFEILFKEDANLSMIKIHKLWIDYIENVFMGRCISPCATKSDMASVQSAVIDYMVSVYVFSLRPDGKTIQYWAKYTGVFPTKNPYEVFASEHGQFDNISRISMDYQFSYKEDMDIAILRDFNLLSLKPSQITNPIGNYFDEAPVDIATNANVHPQVRRVVDKTTNRATYELLLSEPSRLGGTYTNYTKEQE